MPQDETVPKQYERCDDGADSNLIDLKSATVTKQQATFTFECIRPGVYRSTFSSNDHPLPPFPSCERPKRASTAARIQAIGSHGVVVTDDAGASARIDWIAAPILTLSYNDEILYTDLPHRSYVLDGTGVAHYTRYFKDSMHVGLGEKAAPFDLSGRSFVLSATDSFGYDVHHTDPLYKHIPLLIVASAKGVVGTFSTSHARGSYSIGSEMDGMWGRFKVYRQYHGGLEQYHFVGRTMQEVVYKYAELVGFPLLVPRWAFGYLAGGMKYSMLDDPPAYEALADFASKLVDHDIPCSGFQLSSGYTIAETEPKTRNVFTWNRHRFPDPEGFVRSFREKGIRLIANIKPYVLTNHPAYAHLAASGALFTDPNTGTTALTRLWSAGGGESGEGSHIDFTSPAGYIWWYDNVVALRKLGIDCPWNDNNEYTIPSDKWLMSLSNPSTTSLVAATKFGRKDAGLWGRALNTEVMAKASHDALLAAAPEERAFVLTRSATAGTMRYACSTWSGDNVTSWSSLQGSTALSLNAGLSLLQNYGHDIGGFEGPQPSPELLLRWVQVGIYGPRFAVNCFKTSTEDNSVGDVIELWMYPEILPEIRKAIKRRYEILPYLYNLMLQSHRSAVPPMRWVGWGYEDDAEVWASKALREGEGQFWLGDSLMIGSVFTPGAKSVEIYLPKRGEDDAYLNINAPYQYLDSGEWATIDAPLMGSIPVIARVGGAIIVGKAAQTVAPGDLVNEANLPEDDYRGIEIFPRQADKCRQDGLPDVYTWLEDDGISVASVADEAVATCKFEYTSEKDKIAVKFALNAARFEPPWARNGLWVILPVGETRVIEARGGSIRSEAVTDERGQKKYLYMRGS
nr:hypothetical protein B0A51_14800 [Rachicladosporium sp. CCFEE 5018]